jgi:hypothetical protein
MPWPQQLDRFSLLKIERVSAGRDAEGREMTACEGIATVTTTPIPEVGANVWLALELPESVSGDVIAADPATGRVLLHLLGEADLAPGQSYPLLPGYHDSYHVWLVLDESRRWTRTRFTPSDAIATPAQDGFTCLRPSGEHRGGGSRYYPPQPDTATPSPSGEIVEGGWDHEHCALCWATISPYAEPEGYVDDEWGKWVCCKCYDNYVSKHDLGFIG